MDNFETFTKDEVFSKIISRRKELLEQINHPNEKDTKDYIFSLKVRWNELGNLLDALGYEAYLDKTESLDNLFEEYLD